MKAITLQQPWATLVALGVKRFETRGWRTAYRGPQAIHAAAAFPAANRALCATPAFRLALRGAPRELPRGAVLAVVELREITPTAALIDQPDLFGGVEDRLLAQLHFGDFTAGRFAWVPVPARGALSLWEWNEPSSATGERRLEPKEGK